MAAPHNDNIRKRILDEASTLMRTKSFTDISLAEIAEQAGITKGSIYYYYKNKNHILYDIVDDYMALLYNDLHRWIGDDEKDTSLPRLVRYVIERGVHDPGRSLRLNITLDAIAGDPVLRDKLLERYSLFRLEIGNLIAGRLEQKPGGRDAEFYGWLMVMLVDGLMIQELLGNHELKSEDFSEALINLLSKD